VGIKDFESGKQVDIEMQGERKGKGGGFTLLELIISITIIGIIVLMVASAMRLGFRSVSSGEKKIESLERMRSSLTIIDSQIQSGIPLTYIEGGDLKYYFRGQRELLRLSTNYSIWNIKRGYVVVTYRVVSDVSGKKSLYASENIIGIKDKKEVKLLDGFDEIYFEYFYKHPLEKEAKWTEEMKEGFFLPEKIRLNLANGIERFSLIVPVRVRGLGY